MIACIFFNVFVAYFVMSDVSVAGIELPFGLMVVWVRIDLSLALLNDELVCGKPMKYK